MSRNRKIPFRLLVLLMFIWGLFCLRIGSHFFGVEDAFRVWVPSAVRNYQIYGTNEIGLMIVRDSFPQENPENRYYYSHHPPLLVWLPALVSQFAGNNELAIRFVFPVAMMLAVSAYYVLLRRLFNEDIAFWSLIFFSVAPLIAYYQPSYGHDPLGFMAIFLFAAIFVKWFRQPKLKEYLGLCFSAVLAVWTAWPAVFFIATFGIYALIFGKNTQRVALLILGVLSIAALLLMLILYESWWSGAIASLIDSFFFRVSNLSQDRTSAPFTAWEWLSTNSRDILQFGGIGLSILALLGIAYISRNSKRFAKEICLILLLAGIIYLLVFRNAAIVHIYYEAFLMPVIALSAAMAFIHARRSKARFAKALTDAALLAYVLQAGVVNYVLVNSTYQPSLDHIISYINSQESLPQELMVLYPLSIAGSDFAVEYYTQRDFQWHVLPHNVNQNIESLYIYCNETQDYVLQYFEPVPPSTQLDNLCTVYHFSGDD